LGKKLQKIYEEVPANKKYNKGMVAYLKEGKSSYRINLKPGLKLTTLSIQFYIKPVISGVCMDFEVRTDEGKSSSVPVHSSVLRNDAPLRLTFDEDMEYRKYLDVIIDVKDNFKGNLAVSSYEVDGTVRPIVDVHGLDMTEYEDLTYQPLVSIITPTYNTDLGLFKETVNSVLNQSYYNFEFCIVDDNSTSKDLRNYIRNLSTNKRVRVNLLENNLGISGASNVGIDMCSGEFICFLDHDDLLDPNALFFLVQKLQSNEYDAVYSDEDKINLLGNRVEPHYKPDWNYHLLLSNMYTCHLTLYRKSIADKIGGLDSSLDGAQDYDFMLRFSEHSRKIGHVPKVLYHWRKVPGSTAVSIINKPEARISGSRALTNHLKRIGKEGYVSAGMLPSTYRVNYDITCYEEVTIIVPFKDKVNLLRNLMDSLDITGHPNFKVLLLNNQSVEQETLDYLETLPETKEYDIRVISYDKPFNFAAMNNYAVKKTHSDYVLFLNNDIEIMHPEWLDNMVQLIEQENVAAVGAKLLYADHTIQHAGVVVGMLQIAGHGHKGMSDTHPGYFGRPNVPQEISAVTGACMLVRRDSFDKVGGFDERFPGAFNDIDLCLKFRSNNELILYTPYARLYHMESLSRGKNNHMEPEFIEAIKLMEKKWGCSTFVDPYYNINLSLSDTNYIEKIR
jgi:GT2 family glycosyltransferase